MAVTTKAVIKAPSPPRPDGYWPIYLRITIDRVPRLIGLSKYVDPQYWHKAQSTVLKGSGDAQKLNIFIQREKLKINQIILDLQNDDKAVTFEMITKLYKSNGSLDFIEFCRKEIELRRKELSDRTINDHESILRKIERYQPKIKLATIDMAWVTKFEHYLRNTLGNDDNTVATNKKFVRTYYNRAVSADLCKPKDIEWKVSFIDGDRIPLSKLELTTLYTLYEQNTLKELHQQILQVFLYPCFAGGLRFGDLRKLRWNRFKDDWMHVRTSKTGEKIYVPLSKKAKSLLPPRGTDNDLVFKTYDNKYTNILLAEILEIAGLDRKATFHYSRHTFATMSLRLKVDRQTVKRLMGIRSDKVLDIYQSVEDDLVKEEMTKWDAF